MSYVPTTPVPLNGANPPYPNASAPNPNASDGVPFVVKKPEDILSLQIKSKDVTERLALLEQKVDVLSSNFQPKSESGTDWAFIMFVTWICLMVVSIIFSVVFVMVENDKYEKSRKKSDNFWKKYTQKRLAESQNNKSKKAVKVEPEEEEEEEETVDDE